MLVLQARASLSGALANHQWHQTALRKIKAISEMRPPKNHKGVREFLRMVGYYRKFINRFTDAARPMTKLTRKGVKFEWTDECQIGFNYLKTCLTEAPILKYPDPSRDMWCSWMPQIRLQQLF